MNFSLLRNARKRINDIFTLSNMEKLFDFFETWQQIFANVPDSGVMEALGALRDFSARGPQLIEHM